MPSECDEEVVADSEEESFPYPAGHQGRVVSASSLTSARNTVSSIQTAMLSSAKNKGMAGECNISCFTENAASKSAETSISSFAPNDSPAISRTGNSRPRPRPAYKGAMAIAQAISAIPGVHSPLAQATTSSFRELNRDVQMDSSNPSSNKSPQGTFSLDIAERAKMRSRNASKAAPVTSSPSIDKPRPKPRRGSASKKHVSLAPEVINLASDGDDDDELALPPFKPPTNPRAKSKASSTYASRIGETEAIKQFSSPRPGPQGAAAHPSPDTLPTRPTSSILVDSPLPPSGAPFSTVNDQEHDHPPIAFLPNDSDADMFPPSSPLFSPTPAEKKKRKKQQVPNVDRRGDGGDVIDMNVDPQTMPPPPLGFFASSSPDMQGSLPPLPPPFFAPSSPSVNDSGIEINTSDPIPSKPVKKLGKQKTANQAEPKKGKKRAQNVDNDDFGLDVERPKKKKKPDAKSKKVGKKSDLEVVIQTSKVFKSKELIDDDEDLELGSVSVPLTNALTAMAPTTVSESAAPSEKPESLLSAPDLDADGVPETKRGKKATAKGTMQHNKKTRKAAVVLSEDEVDVDANDGGEPVALPKPDHASKRSGGNKEKAKRAKKPDVNVERGIDESEGTNNAIKENLLIPRSASPPASASKQPGLPPSSRSYSIASRTKSTPMSELIRRVNSLPGSPFSSTPHRGTVTPKTSTAYSPYLKSSRSALSRIAPLHPNRRTPPPPLPKPPPPKKTKKQLEREDKWEEELQESVEGWATLTEEERTAMRRAKRAMDEGWED